jgi:hypothetical protein
MIKKLLLRIKRKAFLITTNLLGTILKKLFASCGYIQISLNPVYYKYLVTTNHKKWIESNWTFIIQGPILNLKHLKYFIKNLNVIRDIFPGARVVISTYTQYRILAHKIPIELYDKLILIDENLFSSNFERQVASTHYGISAAKKYKTKFILKMRTDQIIYHPGSLDIFEAMLKIYKDSAGKGKHSLVASSYNSWLYRPFGVSEMLMAGYFNDMRKYWEYDDQIRNFKLKFNKPPKWLTGNNLYYESFLAVKYLARNNFKFTSDIFKDTVEMYRKHFIIVDSMMINQKWFKRNPVWSGNSVVKSGYNLPPNALIEISHADWLAFKLGSHTIRPDKLAARH